MGKVKPRFSICIPVWEQHGFGLQYLKDLIHSIQIQTFQNYEIVISDHSINDDIYEFITTLDNVKYVKNSSSRGNGVHNLNQALIRASGDIIKVMFQDDLMFDRECLEKFDKVFQYEDTKWAVCGCNHTRDGVNFERFKVPFWNDKLLDGVNTISSPSVLAFINKNIELFDENLIMLMDVEYYYHLGQKYGLPTIIQDCLVTNRCHENQISSMYVGSIEDEIRYCNEKYL
jgi:glycosyltransferase involved in cell wall biosynthesis